MEQNEINFANMNIPTTLEMNKQNESKWIVIKDALKRGSERERETLDERKKQYDTQTHIVWTEMCRQAIENCCKDSI